MTQLIPTSATPTSAADPTTGGDLWGLRYDTTWRPHAVRMTGHLVRAGVLTDGAWRQALLDVPRHHFTPTSFHLADPAAWAPRHRPDGGPRSPSGRAWLRAVYDQVPHVVALSGIDIWGRQHPVAVNPDPATTTRMLQALDVRATDRILELGTGSAHTTALLAHRVSPSRVTSVELDLELHHLATHRLAQLDLHPHLVLADSTTLDTAPLRPDPRPASAAVGSAPGGGESMAGFDRVLVGHTVDHLPAAWLRHTRPGATVLATLAGGLGAAHPAVLRHTPDHHLTGAFLPWPATELPHTAATMPGTRPSAAPSSLSLTPGAGHVT